MVPAFFRNDDGIGDQVVDIRGAECAGISEIADLNRRSTQSEDAYPILLREAFKVDCNIDFEAPREHRNLAVGKRADLYKTVERPFEPAAHGIMGHRTEGE